VNSVTADAGNALGIVPGSADSVITRSCAGRTEGEVDCRLSAGRRAPDVAALGSGSSTAARTTCWPGCKPLVTPSTCRRRRLDGHRADGRALQHPHGLDGRWCSPLTSARRPQRRCRSRW
jgi:hypothetical protein